MSNAEIVPPIAYSPQWLILGILCILVVILSIGIILFVTRHKEPRTIASLKPKATSTDYEAIRKKYLDILEVIGDEYNARTITARIAHQRISLAARQFIFEFNGIPAHNLTLSDLRKSARLKQLGDLIGNIYPSEFDRIDRGTVADSYTNTKKVIQGWR